jgi:HD-like signal output (HDOD) protein
METSEGNLASDSQNTSYDVVGTIFRTNFLPPYFAVAQKALKLLDREDVSFRELSEIITTDQSLVSKILGMVNSVHYSLLRNITRVDDAVSYLGIREVRNIVMAASTRDLLSGGSNRATWIHSLSVAYLSEALGRQSRKGLLASDAFTAGLLHDLGIPFIAKNFPNAENMIVLQTRISGARFYAEKAILGYTHAQIGNMILSRWQLPENVREAVLYHHDPWEGESTLAPIICLANETAKISHESKPIDERLLNYCNISMRDLEGLNDAIQLSVSEFEKKLSGSE